jgi:hypothetical protein
LFNPDFGLFVGSGIGYEEINNDGWPKGWCVLDNN